MGRKLTGKKSFVSSVSLPVELMMKAREHCKRTNEPFSAFVRRLIDRELADLQDCENHAY